MTDLTQSAFNERMPTTEAVAQKPGVILQAERELAHNLAKIGPSEAVDRYLRSYGKVRVRAAMSFRLMIYFRWLKTKGLSQLSPDELIIDNLRCIAKAEPEDVATRRRHREWIERFVNEELKDRSMTYGIGIASTVSKFYEKNDSQLFGRISIAEREGTAPDSALRASDIRLVLKALPLGVRVPLLCVWQSSCEINRVLALRWSDVDAIKKGEYPLKLQFIGRKGHKRAWHTYLGRDAIAHLKLWEQRCKETAGRDLLPGELVFVGKKANSGLDPSWLNDQLRRMALRMHVQGLVQNGNPTSWRSHLLRHSFKTEAEHAGVKSALVEFFMGHEGGIQWVYDNRDEVHPQDFVDAYKKLEPHVSLDYNEAVAKEQSDENARGMMDIILSLQKRIASLEFRREPSGAQGRP